jgi:hypothetical protein
MTRPTVLALVTALLTGCTAAPSATPPSATPPSASATAAVPASTGPSEPPSGPSDFIPHTDLLVGTIIRGGDGPCYGLRTDDGTEYALHSVRGWELPHGKRVKLRTENMHMRLDCGPGHPLGITAVESID